MSIAFSSIVRRAPTRVSRCIAQAGIRSVQPLLISPRRSLSTIQQKLDREQPNGIRSSKDAPVQAPAATTIAEQTGLVDLPQAQTGDRKVAIGWTNGVWSRFHNIWLRDHCRCPECFHPVTKQRLLNTFAIRPNIQPKNVVSKVEGLEVTWPDAHVSLYPWHWLMRNSYDPPVTPHALPDGSSGIAPKPPSQILWGSRIQKDPPTVTYEQVMSDDAGLLKWVEKIDQFGFCFVTGVPPTPETTEAVTRRIAYIRETHYGGFWEFTSDLKHGDTAYTTIKLGAHTDTTYFSDPCGLQLFHLLSHTPSDAAGATSTSLPSDTSPPQSSLGGQTLLVDGFYAASILKELHPQYYDLLSRIRIPTHAAGSDDSLYRAIAPILVHAPASGAQGEERGPLVQVRYNNDDRSVLNGLQPCEVEPWYDALRAWHECLTSPDSEYWVQLTPGTLVAINNQRVLHGRSSFVGRRRMCGAYVGIDDFKSRLEVLRGRIRQPEGRSVWDPSF